jgi:glycosyltransferase involved in cell wall biosynthesis
MKSSKILVISQSFPYPPYTGAKIRMFEIIKYFSTTHLIDLICTDIGYVDEINISRVRKLCRKVYVYKIKKNKYIPFIKTIFKRKPYGVNKFYTKKFNRKSRKLIRSENYDIIWCSHLNMSVYLEQEQTQNSYNILDQTNSDELFWQTYYENSLFFFIKLFAKINISNIRRFRTNAINVFDLVLSVSERDKNFTKQWLPKDILIEVVPNGIDISFYKRKKFRPNDNTQKNIIFCGSMDVHMNIKAVKDFVKNILPRIQKNFPEAKFWVVGRNPHKSVLKLANDSVLITGSVKDVRQYYNHSIVSVAPFRYGGGTKLKVLEALAIGLPIVSTSIGVQGLNVINEKHILIRDEWDTFADGVIKLINDSETRKLMVKNGRKLVESEYSWQVILEKFSLKYKEVFFAETFEYRL